MIVTASSAAEQLCGACVINDGDVDFYGMEFDAAAGFSVTLACDFNGDGFDDMVVGSPFINENLPGRTCLRYSRADDDAASRMLSLANAGVLFLGVLISVDVESAGRILASVDQSVRGTS